MTDAKRLETIKTLIKEHTKANTANKKAARAALVKEGIYTAKGRLRVEFGGQTRKTKAATAA